MTEEHTSDAGDEEPDLPEGDVPSLEKAQLSHPPLIKMPRLYPYPGFDKPFREIREAVRGTQEMQRLADQLGEMLRLEIPPPDLSLMIPKVEWPQLRLVAGDIAARLPQRDTPMNWRGDTFDRARLVELLEEGIAVVGVPPAAVLNELVAAAPDARLAVLDANRNIILAACRTRLAKVTPPEIVHQADLLQECIAMARTGSTSGAQALAASVFDTVFRGIWRAGKDDPGQKFSYGVVKDFPQVNVSEDNPLAFREACVLAPVSVACESFYDSDPMPSIFNRHASAHATGPEQYTPVNALMAIMLAVSLVCEIHHGYLDFEPRPTEP